MVSHEESLLHIIWLGLSTRIQVDIEVEEMSGLGKIWTLYMMDVNFVIHKEFIHQSFFFFFLDVLEILVLM